MTNRIVVIVALVLLLGASLLLTKWIIKLPSKYERQPRELSDWNALDVGLDPSDTFSQQSEKGESTK